MRLEQNIPFSHVINPRIHELAKQNSTNSNIEEEKALRAIGSSKVGELEEYKRTTDDYWHICGRLDSLINELDEVEQEKLLKYLGL